MASKIQAACLVVLWVLGALSVIWPHVALLGKKEITQGELNKLSPTHQDASDAYLSYGLSWLLLTAPAICVVGFWVNNVTKSGLPLLAAGGGWLFSSIAITVGLFAKRKGVYPTSRWYGKGTTFKEVDIETAARIGQSQMRFAAFVMLLTAVFMVSVRLWPVF